MPIPKSGMYGLSLGCWLGMILFALGAALAGWLAYGWFFLIPTRTAVPGAMLLVLANVSFCRAVWPLVQGPIRIEATASELRWLRLSGWRSMPWHTVVQLDRSDVKGGNGRLHRYVRVVSSDGDELKLMPNFKRFQALADTLEALAGPWLPEVKTIEFRGPLAYGSQTVRTPTLPR
jgi:hypothetical protein